MTLQQICPMITTMKNILYLIIAQQKDFMGELSVYEQSGGNVMMLVHMIIKH